MPYYSAKWAQDDDKAESIPGNGNTFPILIEWAHMELCDTDLHIIPSWLAKKFWFCTKTFITWRKIDKV